jgi:hypothetical protein
VQELDLTIGQLKEAYDQYLKTELATPSKSSIIYDNGWYVRTGRSFASPHPHRHFKFDEFVKCGMDDPILFSSFMI